MRAYEGDFPGHGGRFFGVVSTVARYRCAVVARECDVEPGVNRGVELRCKVSTPVVVGRPIADLVLDSIDEMLENQETWTVGNPA